MAGNIKHLEKKNAQKKRHHLLLLLFLMFSMGARAAAELAPDDVFELEDKHGIDYRKIEHEGQTAHVLRVDTSRFEIALLKAEGLEKSSELAKKGKAIVAINAGFFESNGSPAGAFKLDGKWIKFPRKNRGVVGWRTVNKETKFYFDRLGPKQDEKGIESKLDKDGDTSDLWWETAEYIVGGTPLLINEGEIVDPNPEKTLDAFLERKYARTAIGVDDNELILVAVEGGDSFMWEFGWRYGMSINELARFMQSLGCQYALNLDGGRSSTMIADISQRSPAYIAKTPFAEGFPSDLVHPQVC